MVQIKKAVYGKDIKEIGVVSDTHIPTRGRRLPPEIFNILKDVQLILHAGDLVDENTLFELQTIAPVEAVAGNMDPVHLQAKLGRLKLVEAGGITLGMLHGDAGGRNIKYKEAEELFLPHKPRAIVFGHLHVPVIKEMGGVFFFNPGSLVDPRQEPRATCGKLFIEGERVRGIIYYLDK